MMKTLTKYSSLLFIGLICLSCAQEEGFKTDRQDYDQYLTAAPVKTNSKYFELWDNKIMQDSAQLLSLGNVASEYTRFFEVTGDIEHLKRAEQSLEKAVDIAAIGKAGYLRALARNYISQHRFKEALELASEAMKMRSGVNATHGLLFDVHMELGNYGQAQLYLDSIQNMSDFGYLIRVAKWNDHKGDLETAIRFMEKAKEKAESSNNRNLLLWSYTNLADFYGHAGRIEESYRFYLKALQMDPQNAYAKKGIAWIVYSHERNGKEALRILDSIIKANKSPEYHLLKAEIASFLDDETLRMQSLDNYYKSVAHDGYGQMYNAYNVGFYLDVDAMDRALHLAKQEVRNRPTPETYGWLAYSLLKRGEKEQALELVEDYVEGQTFEPEILFCIAEVYKANGHTEKVKEIKKELLGAVYELGPVKEMGLASL
ncbi:tetratricopeptide repeat protein [Flagellimonas amoyensis]|uniref:tetratricopeptide repeat protein n=1 Tax=Flagellimonas amoyensis TaxID=2169401 RepID=UPI001F457299|nr:tetratricopeptide repeat protein [Allomuricauda amoyensis]